MFTAVVVFPTPPFWLAIAMTLDMGPLRGDLKRDYFTIVPGIRKEKTCEKDAIKIKR
jgi:hypothetical protein